MQNIAAYVLVYLGSLLMVYNIYGFIRFVHGIQRSDQWRGRSAILYFPVGLLVLFLLGYLAVGLFGNPDLIVAGILFGGSVFVFAMYRLLDGITQRVMEAERLRSDLMAAEKSNQTKSALLANISHEMRTPLNVIMGMDELALRNPDLPKETEGQLQKIGYAARNLLGLVNNMLDMNRIEEGGLSVHKERFSLRDALVEVDSLAQSLCEKKGLVYHMSVEGEVADAYLGDETQLKQVLLSMLDNAVKYTDVPGEVSFAVRVSEVAPARERTSHELRFAVADTGVGMDAEFVPKVFDTFSQEDDTSTNRFGGGGLSLAVGKSVAVAMGGDIFVQSVKGEGSTFELVVPLELAASEQASPDVPGPVDSADAVGDERPAPHAPTLEGRHILIADDMDENAEIVADLLDLEGAIGEHAQNGQVALDMFSASAKGYYDAVLMDLRMPVVDGLEATRRLRSLDRADARVVPIVALSANAFESDVQEALQAGMNAHLAKPVDVELLYATLLQLMSPKASVGATEGKGE